MERPVIRNIIEIPKRPFSCSYFHVRRVECCQFYWFFLSTVGRDMDEIFCVHIWERFEISPNVTTHCYCSSIPLQKKIHYVNDKANYERQETSCLLQKDIDLDLQALRQVDSL